MATRQKAAAVHGIEHVQFAPKTGDTYAAPISFAFARSLSLTPQLERVEQHADNRLIFGIPNDTGWDGSVGTTARDVPFEIATGMSKEVTGGVAGLSLAQYPKGALYYEHVERDENGKPQKVKTWLFNVEVSKGDISLTTDTNTATFEDYEYPIRVLGDKLMAAAGEGEYVDENGMTRLVYMLSAWPDDTGYAAFGNTVPAPKAAQGA